MATLKYLSQYFTTALNVGGGIDDSQTTGIILLDVSGVDITKPGQICITYSDPIDTSVAEWIDYTSINGSNELVGAVRGREGYSAHAHLQSATVAFVMSASHHNDVVDLLNGTEAGIKIKTALYDTNGNEVIKTPATTNAVNEITVTNAATGNAPEISVTGADDNIDLYLKGKGSGRVKAYDGSSYVEIGASIISTTKYAPQGFLLNGKIVPSVTSNNLTVALKGMDGNDPSASNPIYVRIGDTVRTITSALSVTTNAGTNWCNAGATELATKEIDYFVYLGYNTTDGVVIGFGRIPSANEYGDFSTTSTNEKYCAISTITNAVSGDDYELVGRFAATLSAGAGYTWSVPTFTNKNLIQKPIYETRWLNYVPTLTGSGGSVGSFATDRTLGKYKIRDSAISLSTHSRITNVGSWSGDLRMAIPFKPNYESTTMIMLGTLVANNANPLAASKGLAHLNDGSSLIYFTANIWNSYTQWSSVAVNDSVLLSATYAI